MGFGLKKIQAAVETYFENKDIFVPVYYTFKDEESNVVRTFDLNRVQRFFMTFHEPSSCFVAQILSNAVMSVIVVNIIVNIMMTLPQYRSVVVTSCSDPACDNDATLCPNETMCAPTTDPTLVEIDDYCVIIFTIEYLFRLFTVWSVPMRLANLVPKGWDDEEMFVAGVEDREFMLEPRQKWYSTTVGYFFQGKNVIDLVAILPFYITLANPGSNASLSFIRALRLFRIVRAFNMNASAGVTNLIIRTVQESLEVILLLLFFSSMIIIIFGSIIVDAEAGKYTVSEAYPDGAYIRKGVDGDYERTPFVSTLMGMYWAVITMTTVGYGDIVPVTAVGRLIAVACAFVGVLFMALPISILGANFTVQYQRLSASQRQERKRRTSVMLAKKSSIKTGKEVKLKEVEMASFSVKGNGSESSGGGLKTGNRMADAIMEERNKDEQAMAAVYHRGADVSASRKRSESSSDETDTPRSRNGSAYDPLSPVDIDLITDGSATPGRSYPATPASMSSAVPRDDKWIRSLVANFRELEEKATDETVSGQDKREVLQNLSDNLLVMSSKLREEAAMEVVRAEERSRILNASLAMVSKTCQHILENVPDEDH